LLVTVVKSSKMVLEAAMVICADCVCAVVPTLLVEPVVSPMGETWLTPE